MNIDYKRSSGILLHISSLYSDYGIGDLGKEAYHFVDQLASTGATYWQLLPLGPTGYGNSPYSARSCFAGNELFINLDYLINLGLLTKEDLQDKPEFPSSRVDFNMVYQWKLPLLKKAASTFLLQNKNTKGYKAFLKEAEYWLEDYALFMVLYEKYNDARWYSIWDKKESVRDKETLNKLRKDKAEELQNWYALQYLFSTQWRKLKEYANSKGILLIGDAPIFAGGDSADTWSHLEIFKTDKDGHYSEVSGVPPDIFSTTGQLWGTPVYDWKVLKDTNYDWWFRRIKQLLSLTDVLRIDHFRGLDAYYSIPAKDKTAEFGKWVKAPGAEFFKSLTSTYGKLPIIAEDLGLMTPSVEKLRKSNHFPGMKIAQFGFTQLVNNEFNAYDNFLPHNYERDYIAYTGTHDNDTTRGWYNALTDSQKHQVREYLASPDEEIVWSLIRAIMLSHADIAIVPMQDLLELDGSARMNYPSTCNDKNWSWRLEKDQFGQYPLSRFTHLVRISGRNNKLASEVK